MGVEDLYASDSTWLKADDLKNKEHKAVIDKITIQEVKDDKGKPVNKLDVSFVGKDKSLLLNKTNATAIAKGYGDDFSEWQGKEIIMYPTVTDFGGQTVDCIRVRVPLETAGEEDAPFQLTNLNKGLYSTCGFRMAHVIGVQDADTLVCCYKEKK